MDLTFTPQQEAWRQEVKDFLARELPREYAFDHEFEERDDLWEFAFEFTRKVGARGWIGLTWPKAYGGLERTPVERSIMMEEFGLAEAPLINLIGWGLAAGSLLFMGTEEQKQRFLPPIGRMQTFWAEGLTEPDAGSDLASLKTTAVRDGDSWVVNGQKTFTTWGSRADVLYLAARTDPDVPKHKGLSIFCLDLKLPGVSMTPLYNLGGGRQNHTFLDNVRIPADMLIGEENQGWYAIMNSFYGGGGAGGAGKQQHIFSQLVQYCKETRRDGVPLSKDPIVRSQLAELRIMLETMKMLGWEGLSLAENRGAPPFGGALGVVVYKETTPRFAQLCLDILGPLGQLKSGPWAPLAGQVEALYRQSYANHAGGTPQVKRMVLATRGLGLPR
ncbi:MAG: acyl-CoA dehydrogenase family protein [Dehalococcoidia bacterium]